MGGKSAPEPAGYHAPPPPCGSPLGNRGEPDLSDAGIAATSFPADQTHLSAGLLLPVLLSPDTSPNTVNLSNPGKPLLCRKRTWGQRVNHLDKILKALPRLKGFGRWQMALLRLMFVVDLLNF